MPEASASSAPLPPPSTALDDENEDMELLYTRQALLEARDQLAQVRSQLLALQEQNEHLRTRQAQNLGNRNNDPEPRNTEVGTNVEIQTASAEPQSMSTTDGPTSAEEQIITEPSVTETVDSAPRIESSQPLGADSAGDQLQAEEVVQSIISSSEPPPPPVHGESRPASPPPDATNEPPEWGDVEEDTSAPDEEELKEIEASNDVSARDVKYHEESFYAEPPDDPEQQPLQKMRLSWVIKGVRGTKDKPNRARIMNSPAVYVGGFYWYLKFFPRGNNSSALSAYVQCSRKEPKPDEDVPENTFSAVYGAPDADLGELQPAIAMSIPATGFATKEKSKAEEAESSADDASKKTTEGEAVQQEEGANTSADAENSAAIDDQDDDTEDWRVSAQIGIIIYNPDEPRTKFDMAACHQFNKHNDDWGWTNFHGPWSEIHKRRRGQRQALLRNDTLALDAYVRIFNDPSQALWWHQCGAESQWDSVSLAGYPAMGTKHYHSPGVAGITSWLLLAPFRKIFQSLETDSYRKDTHTRPQTLCTQLQMILYLMRKQKKDEKFVSLEAIIEVMDKLDELGTDVVTFWEGFRRSLELELQTNRPAIEQITDIFDGRPSPDASPVRASPLRIPVENVSSIQGGLNQLFAESSTKQCFPKFLTVELERQKFDTVSREWKLLYDRVRLSEELDLSQWSAETETSKYTLYGFVVHADERNSGRFYAILRPNGPGSKWLAFDDDTPNQVISYTKHRIAEFEGLEGDALRENKAPRLTAYVAMYVRTDLLKDFLPGALEPYELSPWLKNCPQVKDYVESKDIQTEEEDTISEVKLQIYSSQRAKKRRGLVDIQDLKDLHALGGADPPQHLTVPAETTYQELRQKLAKWNDIDSAEKIKLWIMQPPSPGAPLNFSFKRISRLYKTVWDRDCATQSICLWMHVLNTDDDVKTFGDPEPSFDLDVFDRTVIEERGVDSHVQPGSETAAAEDLPERGSALNDDAASVQPQPDGGHDLAVPAVDLTGAEDVSTNDTSPVPVPAASEPLAMSDSVVTQENTEEPTVVRETVGISSSGLSEDTAAIAPGETLNAAETSPQQGSGPHTEDSSAEPAANADEMPTESAIEAHLASISAEDESLIAALIAQDFEHLGDSIDDSQGDVAAPNEAAVGVHIPVDTSDPSVADEPSRAHTTDLPASERPEVGTEEMNPSPPAPPQASNDDAQSDSSEEDEIVAVRPVPFYYGFIQLFDAQAQDFVIHGDFLAQTTDNVKDFVRKQLGYGEGKDFLIWRRGNAYRLTSVHADSTFEDIRDDSGYRHDGFVLVVGDVLSDAT